MGIVSDHENTNRERIKQQLEVTLFPAPGKVNIKFYEQTLMSHMILDDGEKDYQEEVADIYLDEEEQEQGEVSLDDHFRALELKEGTKKVN